MSDVPFASSSSQATGDRPRNWLRWTVRFVSLLIAVALAVPLVPWTAAPIALPAGSPFIAMSSAIATRGVSIITLATVPIVALALVRRRFFCNFICPLGSILDCAGFSRHGRRALRHVPRLGRLFVWFTWAGAVFGAPLLIWLDPLSLFSALLGHGTDRWLMAGAASVIVLSSLWPGLWCTKLCPLGATQDIIHLPRILYARRRPTVSEQTPRGVPDDPQGAGRRTTRRRLLAGTAALTASVAGAVLARTLRPRAAGGCLRPPGAVDESQFWSLCLRCGNCGQVCPTNVIRSDWNASSPLALAAPLVEFEEGYCREDCHACSLVCPSGAIRRLSLERKLEAKIGLAVVELDLCLLTYDRECEICRRVCPREAVSFRWSEETYTVIPEIHSDPCNGCGACVVACPGTNHWELEADPAVPLRRAIQVVPSGRFRNSASRLG
jgi:ferredoxin-type protein NapF